MNALCLLSARAGGGKTFTAANLAPILAGHVKVPVVLLERGLPEASELALHLGQPPQAWTLAADAKAGEVGLACVATVGELRQALADLESTAAWVLVDGVDLEHADWGAWLEACGRGVLCERGDLQGCRRALRLVNALEAAHFPKAGLHLAWAGVDPAQPLPPLAGLASSPIPAYPRALERLASGVLPAAAEPNSALTKAFRLLAGAVLELPRQARPAPDPDLGPAARPSDARPSDAQETALLRRVLESLRGELDLGTVRVQDLASKTFRADWTPRVREAAARLLAREDLPWMDRDARGRLVEQLLTLTLGYGPLEAALQDPEVTEIMVNRPDQVYLERAGKLSLSPLRFWDEAQVLQVIERIVAPLGRRIDESSPKVDARLPDGSRVNAIIPPLALKGPCLTIRKFPTRRLSMADLLSRGALSPEAAQFLQLAVEHKKNILVSGGTGSGKTTLLNALSSFIPEGERIVTIEDSAELKLQQPHVVTLESRPKNLEGQGEISIRDLVINSLRMRPDRIVIGECRGGEALDMLQAMNTGQYGCPTYYALIPSRPAFQGTRTQKPFRNGRKSLLHGHRRVQAPWRGPKHFRLGSQAREMPLRAQRGQDMGVYWGGGRGNFESQGQTWTAMIDNDPKSNRSESARELQCINRQSEL